ncbi:MAG: 3-hydroxyacyl-CoA dehydrogenase NAD-binding domain-containing protein [Clostridiales bacterium]|nr:3-hydroxyacyl-CoA dehydrogenase NAD-binding domain-containing protein [Clostridiales bacterium]
MAEKGKVACLGAGVIGYSYAIRFAMGGYQVSARSRSEDSSLLARKRTIDSLESLVRYGVLTVEEKEEIFSRITFTTSIEQAVADACFIQESASEHYKVKQELIAEFEPYAPSDAVVASSTSGLLISEIAKCAKHPERFVGGHPYNPPHLIPLVEITRGEKTAEWAVDRAVAIYSGTGMEPVVLKKEVLGFISNRLQWALYREVADLVMNGVCTVEDADRALTFGPGLRWGIMGPSLIFELNGGKGGISGILRHLGPSIHLWLQDMAKWDSFPEEWPDIAQEGVNEEMANRDPAVGNTRENLEEYRDDMLIKLLRLHGKLR